MENTAQQIEDHIEQTRQSLGSNLEELEHKVNSITDWRKQFQARPGALMGLAFAGGVVLAAVLGGPNRQSGAVGHHRSAVVMDTWDNLKGAVIGVAATRLVDYARDVIARIPQKSRPREM